MYPFRHVCSISRRKKVLFFFFAAAFFFLWQAGPGKCFGADSIGGIGLPDPILVASARPTGNSLISLPSEMAGSTATKTTAAVPTTKYPRPNEMLQGVVYDLKRTKDLKPTNLIGGNEANMNKVVDRSVFGSMTKPFVNGWRLCAKITS